MSHTNGDAANVIDGVVKAMSEVNGYLISAETMQNATSAFLALLLSLLLATIFASDQDLTRGDVSSGLWEREGLFMPRAPVKRSNLYALFKKVNYEANRRKLYNEMVKKSDTDYFY
uniref:Uncharacterized protein n=1 Tax=Steinernema glaseri TaxID=37863 RepID=A0A1I7YWR7_9BILA